MPVWKHTVTGKTQALADVNGYAPGTWEKIADESPQEKADRELREAIENKVEVELDDVPVPLAEVNQELIDQQEKAVEKLNLAAAEETEGTSAKKSTPKKSAAKKAHVEPVEGE